MRSLPPTIPLAKLSTTLVRHALAALACPGCGGMLLVRSCCRGLLHPSALAHPAARVCAEEEAHTSPEGSAEGSSSGEEEYVVEEEEAAALWSGSDGEEDVYGLTSDPSAAADAYRSQLARFPLLRDFVPPAMQHELAAELR